ncbi:GTP diphosphokinase [Celerinatantimonas sp. YJH-8]|uniref:GTP diphosphokinase n=1 Tax=Celerinatantimonas sp. YJH-8 TaxID=3228714 RepID=UPI0038C31DB1
MVSIRETHINKELLTNEHEWAETLNIAFGERQALLAICESFRQLDEDKQTIQNCLNKGKEMVEILITLNMDITTLEAALVFPFAQRHLFNDEQLAERFRPEVIELQGKVGQMDAIHDLRSETAELSPIQIDNVRRMLLAMVGDVRAIVIKIAERICYLRSVKDAPEDVRVVAAKESQDIYAPLANRLGIGQLKWELEDLMFRYQHPDTYKQIAKQLDEKRLDREKYIEDFVATLSKEMKASEIRAEVYGRPKHIYSIWRKMQKKHLAFDELFDVRAVRIIAERLQDCYGALGVVHTLWHHLPSEFDDYVANPKPNGYQSIHTVVMGPAGKTVEIQIRTRKMHDDAELGVAAHWKYKEGNTSTAKNDYEDKIAWLRKLLKWQEDMTENGTMMDELRSQVFDDRVYVFTPKGEIVDLPAGSTPLDFAYYVHSLVGHRCIGAKIGGRIVPFTYQLQTGEQIEIITQKEPNPSRDWLNPNLGYVKTSRARSKISTWFKKQDRDKNIIAGKEILDTELARHGLKMADVDPCIERFNVQSHDDLLAAIGAGDVRINQLINHLQAQLHQPSAEEEDRQALEQLEKNSAQAKHQAKKAQAKDHIVVEGVGNLLTHIARCCQPIPGDKIQGFITQGRGISIHSENCEQLKELKMRSPERVIDAIWGENYSGGYSLTIRVMANDRSGLLRDITTVLANDKVNVLGMNTRSDLKTQTATMDIEVEVYNLDTLSRVLGKVNQLPGILDARRLH